MTRHRPQALQSSRRPAPTRGWLPVGVGCLLTFAAVIGAVGCGRSTLPSPEAAASAYAAAARRGDAAAIHAMLTSESQRNLGVEGTRQRVADSSAELARQGEALASGSCHVETTAVVRFADGERAVLEVEDGRFRVSTAGVLPAGARTPTEALIELRQALARRSYPGLLQVLDDESRGALEDDLRTLVDGLDEPDTLDVQVDDDTAEVALPRGHWVKLKREAGVWKVEDFD
jgi:hypothetical protein